MLSYVFLHLVLSFVNEIAPSYQIQMLTSTCIPIFQPQERHCLAHSYLPPSLLAALAAIADTNHSYHGQRPGHRPTSVRSSSPYQARQAAIFNLLPSYPGLLVGGMVTWVVSVSVPAVFAAAKGLSSPLLVILLIEGRRYPDTGDNCDARCGYAAYGSLLRAAMIVQRVGFDAGLGEYLYSW